MRNFHMNCVPTDISHEMSGLTCFFKAGKNIENVLKIFSDALKDSTLHVSSADNLCKQYRSK